MSIPVYTSEQMQAWDKFTITNEPISSLDLMERAATLAADEILLKYNVNSVSLFCGPGNNGGDGLVIARLFQEKGIAINVYNLNFAKPSPDFETNYKSLPKEVQILELTEEDHDFTIESELVIDAIFGSGLNRPISGWIGDVTNKINNTKVTTVAIDIPSGLFAHDNSKNDGLNNVIKADLTVTFMSPKMAFFYKNYHQFTGDISIVNIGLHSDYIETPKAFYLIEKDIEIRKRDKFSYKGTNGYLSLIGGIGDMNGAAIIGALAAMKSGSGYVNVISEYDTKLGLNSTIPEAIWTNINSFEINEKSTAIAIGPGLGTSKHSTEILMNALNSELPVVLDADAINLISENEECLNCLPHNAILTPHLGELKRLLGKVDSEEELLIKQIEFSIEYGVYIIQKGPNSKLTCPDGKIYINSTGNPGMGSAGMGDALTGIIGSLLAQGYKPEESAKFGMFIHGMAADIHAEKNGEIGLLATDVISNLPQVINDLAV